MSNASDDGKPEMDLSNPDVTTKYRCSADIANKALKLVVDACVEGADIYELCKKGNDCITEEAGKLYNKKVKDSEKKVEKGIAFPCCVAVNEVGGNFCPLKGESRILRGGDLVKVDLGVHIDGFIAQAAHTLVVTPGEGESPNADASRIADRRADVVMSAWTAAEAALRLVKPGNTNAQVTQIFQACADEFKCQPVAGVLSHEQKQSIIDGSKCIISKESLNDEQKVDTFEFGLNEVYTIDVMMSTGDGKLREQEARSTVFKRALETSYSLKTQKARQFLSEVNKKFPVMPFSIALIEDEQCARVGVSEARRHALLHEFPVMTERPGEYIAHFKFTVLLLPGGTKKVTGLTFEDKRISSSYQVESESLQKLLATSTSNRKSRKKKTDNPESSDA